MRRLSQLLFAVLVTCALPVCAGTFADVEVYDRTSGCPLPLYWHDGRYYVPGEPRHEYELRIRNKSGGRLLAVGSVDGVNVLSGETAAPDQDGYVLDGFGSLSIAGWRKSLQRIAAFYFTALPDSYAARTGRPDEVGVIGVALFRERGGCCAQPQRPLVPMPPAPMASPAPAQSDGATAAPLQQPAAKTRAEAADRLGTGHGRSEYSQVYETRFDRMSATPDEIISIFYDSRSRLIARGIIPQEPRLAQREPDPFPGYFVPDP